MKEGDYTATKLTSTFLPREKYVCHYRNLQLYLKLGMVLTKVHKVMRFHQSDFLKQYIDFCTAKRAASNTPFAKRMYKLFVNAVFGKFIERIRGYLECKICYTEKSVKKWVSSPNFKSMKIISKNLVIVFLTPNKLVFNKAYPIGFSILDLSKMFMFSEYYERIQPKLKSCEVLFSDTDSLSIAVFGKKKTDSLKKLKNIIDFSNYPPNHKRYNKNHANALGFWKDELKGETLREYVGLRSKCYALKIKSKKTTYLKSTCKGVRKGYKKCIPFSVYKRCIKTIHRHMVTQYNIQSSAHVVSTMKLKKVAFTSFDDKRYLLQCGIHSVPYGSYFIPHCKNICLLCSNKK
jgi:hypothetical protein